MAIRGRDARVRFNGTNLGNVKTYKLDIKQETFNVTTFGSSWNKKQAGRKSWSGQLDCYFQAGNSAEQVLMNSLLTGVGIDMAVHLGAEGLYSGIVRITTLNQSSEVSGVVKATFDFKGLGFIYIGEYMEDSNNYIEEDYWI
jgi:predicted secreted protein